MLIEGDFGQVGLQVFDNPDVLRFSGAAHRKSDLVKQRGQRSWFDVEAELAGFDSGRVDKVIDAGAQLVAALPRNSEIFQLLWIQGAGDAIDDDRNEFARGGQ